jgi:hypothetical protein
VSREWDKRAERQGGLNLDPFWGSRLGCATLLLIVAAAACVPWLVKVAFGL